MLAMRAPGLSLRGEVEPYPQGMARDEPEHWLKRVGEGLAAGVMLAEEAAHHRRSWGLPKAHTEPLPLEAGTGRRVTRGGWELVGLGKDLVGCNEKVCGHQNGLGRWLEELRHG